VSSGHYGSDQIANANNVKIAVFAIQIHDLWIQKLLTDVVQNLKVVQCCVKDPKATHCCGVVLPPTPQRPTPEGGSTNVISEFAS